MSRGYGVKHIGTFGPNSRFCQGSFRVSLTVSAIYPAPSPLPSALVWADVALSPAPWDAPVVYVMLVPAWVSLGLARSSPPPAGKNAPGAPHTFWNFSGGEPV